ncbi:MAG: matrixin family metalloprotease [Myxococcales bacterium]|nr:matrixin family metalloprotease [Myxococcales bacterium]
MWAPDQMPISVHVADDGVPYHPDRCAQSGSCCEDSLPAGYCYEATLRGFEAWEDAQCTEWEINVLGAFDSSTFTIPQDHPNPEDGVNLVTFNGDVQASEPGTLAVTYFSTQGQQAFVLDGEPYTRHISADIVFSDDVEFATQADIENGQCDGAFSFESTMTHEIGHFMGMGHSCDDEAEGHPPCTDPTLANATMFWAIPPCDQEAVTINDDDIAGITALYGPSASFSCSHQVDEDLVVGVVPFTLNCVVVSNFLDEIASVEWSFGDGGTSTELAAEHEYTEAGTYTIRMSVEGEREACGPDGWLNDVERVGYVRACDVPAAVFELEQVDALSYQTRNDSDVSVYGCISDIQWDVFAGDDTSGERIGDPIKAWEPILEFPEAGTYTVVMSLGGIAGTGGAKVTLEVGDRAASGCRTVPTTGGMLAVGLLALATRRRRR